MARAIRRLRRGVFPCKRQRERERRAAAELALDADVAAVELDELARDREPEAGPFDLLRRGAHLPEFLEHRPLVLGSDPDARVLDRHFGAAVDEASDDVDPPALGRELE